MTTVTVFVVFKFVAKIIHFRELCKKKIRILYTINVNIFSA